jgi:asparagine synthetase B (glutamine-hydrolysing)
MCGILVHKGRGDNARIWRRGPDATNAFVVGDLTFVHNLLAVTGQPTAQPFVDGDIVCLFNGQIYNQGFVRTDGEVLIPLYRSLGASFTKQLDGEFAVALYDFGNDVALFATDPFKTKPLFINGVECASYRSGVGGEPAAPNETVIKSLRDGRVLDRFQVRAWDLTQWNDSYDSWITAFESAVAKRAKRGCFLGLSSGYDSGGIACALLRLGTTFKAYSFRDQEDLQVLNARAALLDVEYMVPEADLLPWLELNVDDELYTVETTGTGAPRSILDDRASLGAAVVARRASSESRRVALSGQGSDEIISDYAPWPAQSELKGHFPDQLRLWRNFNYSCQESYLMKEEYIAGAFGIENRYPYLDSALVQEFLWLSSTAKNRHYKAPLREYFVRHDFPFEENAKRGFTIGW